MRNSAHVGGRRRTRCETTRGLWGFACGSVAVLLCAGLVWFGCDQLEEAESDPFLPDTVAATTDQTLGQQTAAGQDQAQQSPFGPGQSPNGSGGQFEPPPDGAMPGPGSDGPGGPGGPPLPPPPPCLIRVLDTDGDRTLSAEEIAAAPDVIAALDADGDGIVDAEELRPEPPDEEPDVVALIMKRHDKDGDGLLTAEELLPGRARHLLEEADTSGDGTLDEAELIAWAEQHAPGPPEEDPAEAGSA